MTDLAALLAELPDEAMVPVRWLRARLADGGARASDEPFVGDRSCAEVAKLLGRTPGCVRSWCARGELEAYRLNGREWRIPQASLRVYLDRSAAKPVPQSAGAVDLSSWRRP